jgi:subtilisin family serine protease
MKFQLALSYFRQFFVFLVLFNVSSGFLRAQTKVEPNVVIVKFERSFVESELTPIFLNNKRTTRVVPNFNASSINALNQEHMVMYYQQKFRTDPRHIERHKEFDLDLFFRVEYTTSENPEVVAQAFLANEMVLSASPNYVYAVNSKIPDDPEFNWQWGLRNTRVPGMDINVTTAWEYTTGDPRVIVAIIDGSVDLFHQDLYPNIWKNTGEIPENGIDDDNNGYIDDYYGWNFRGNNGDVSPCPFARESHGTHVAGIVAARTNNNQGIAGIAGGWDTAAGVRIMLFRTGYRDDNDGREYISHGYEAMVYAADNGAAIAQCSWGGSQLSLAGSAAISYFSKYGGGDVMNGGLIIAASGNSNTPGMHYPAAAIGVLAVGSIDQSGHRSPFSNYGPWVEICAPGSDIYSSMPFTDRYGNMSGTSMACPMVSGVAALVLSIALPLPKEQKTPMWLTNHLINTGQRQSNREMGPLVDAGEAVKQIAAQIANIKQKIPSVTQIFPNPTSDKIIILNTSAFTTLSYSLYDMLGKIVYQKKHPHQEEIINMMNFSNGIYTLRVETTNGSYSEKIIKQ